MKKWRICCLFAWCAALLLGFAAAEDGHNWQWSHNANGHVRYCDGCATHSNRLNDESSAGVHTYRCVWPETETNGGEGYLYIDLKCSVCGRSEQVRTEQWGGSSPTCTRTGIRTYRYMGNYKVPEADRFKSYTIPAVPHWFQNYTRNDDATCTDNETETATCVYGCKTVDVREIPNTALGHDPEPHPAKPATCTEAGWKAYETCRRTGCDYTTRVEIPALDHKFVVVDSQAPTCANAGYAIVTCQREGCTVSHRNEIPKLPHDLEHHDAKEPTCTEPGWEAYDTCKNCDYVSAHKEFSALDHECVQTGMKASTCTALGWREYTCQHTGCEYRYIVDVPLLPHDLVHYDSQPATCIAPGWEAYDTCKNCDYTTYAKIPVLEHWYGEWTPAANGTHTATCLRGCGHAASVACETFALGDTLRFCPVCGEISSGAKLTRLQATAKSAQKLKGELTVRTGTLDSGETILTVAFEVGGKLVKTNREVRVTLPASVLGGGTLCLLNADGTEIPLMAEQQGENIVLTLHFKDAPVFVLHVHPAA